MVWYCCFFVFFIDEMNCHQFVLLLKWQPCAWGMSNICRTGTVPCILVCIWGQTLWRCRATSDWRLLSLNVFKLMFESVQSRSFGFMTDGCCPPLCNMLKLCQLQRTCEISVVTLIFRLGLQRMCEISLLLLYFSLVYRECMKSLCCYPYISPWLTIC